MVHVTAPSGHSHAGMTCSAIGRMVMNPTRSNKQEIIILKVRRLARLARAHATHSAAAAPQQDVVLMEAGKIPAGETEIPFEFTVEPLGQLVSTLIELVAAGRARTGALPQGLVETYHGVNVDIRYSVEVDVARSSMFGSNLHAEDEFHVETPAVGAPPAAEAIAFEISPAELENVKGSSVEKIPRACSRHAALRRRCAPACVPHSQGSKCLGS